MPSPALSVIIPTHKRPDTLKKCLEHLEKQTIASELEVIVVSDGPDASTRAIATNTNYMEIPKSHQGIARNRGVERATAPIVLFIGDDIFLASDACEKHLHHYQLSIINYQFAVLGHTTWDPALPINDVMLWLERSGWQFGYPMIERYAHQFLPSDLQHRFTYTSHISLPTEIAKAHPFREDVSLYGWEDIEWGLRLKNAGIKLFYEPDAKAFHHHVMTLEDSLKRMETLGRSAVEMEKMVPELKVVPKGWKRWAYRILGGVPSMHGTHRRAFLSGVLAAEKTS